MKVTELDKLDKNLVKPFENLKIFYKQLEYLIGEVEFFLDKHFFYMYLQKKNSRIVMNELEYVIEICKANNVKFVLDFDIGNKSFVFKFSI